MISGLDIYHPTVWRTCRALMNERRLACLTAVLETPGLSVGEAADKVGLPENQASINLRALQARGLLTARRYGRWIRYFPEPDPLVQHADLVLSALRREWQSPSGLNEKRLMGALRAFTHSRRLTILKCLVLMREATCEELVAKARISQPAVSRHLETLRGAGLVRVTERGAWKLVAKSHLPGLIRTLLDAVVKG